MGFVEGAAMNNTHLYIWALTLLIWIVVCLVGVWLALGSCIPLGQEDNGNGRIETLYLGKCF